MDKTNKNPYDHAVIENKWQEKWKEDKTYSPDLDTAKNPFYNLMMFPYPSAEGLHVGNMYAFTGADVYARFMRMQGNDVFEPIGLDGFGIHSENYALKIGKHPMDQAKISQENFYRQLSSIGNSYDWTRRLETYDPAYYRWTQWVFTELFKAGLATRKKAPVNFCPSCKTVLSDEQVIDSKCERCDSIVEKRDLEQWFFKITDYAERLLNNISRLDWAEKVKIAQRNWIGKSNGARVKFKIKDSSSSVDVFTTRPDTLYGATFVVLSPEHPVVMQILKEKNILEYEAVKEYVEQAKNKTEQERLAKGLEKTGVFCGKYAVNPVNGEELPIWVADYVLMGYGTGAIMAVPAHDTRDFDFAKKFHLPIKQVIKGENAMAKDEAYIGSGSLINSEEWDGIEVPRQMDEVVKSLKERGIGEAETTFHLRDWLISRQRYWGPPIPMIFCESCSSKGISWFSENGKNEFHTKEMVGWYPVPSDALPVELPYIQDYKPLGTGKSPLESHPEFYETVCPNCKGKARRETDVSDTFLDSAWYFFRYLATEKENSAFDNKRNKNWLPVNIYIGGAEHAVLHLLYARFIAMVFHDLGHIDFDEPFSRFFAHGLIIKEGAKMSKSKGNVVVPDDYIKKYGADTLRLYLMFLGPFKDGGDFSDAGIEGAYRFVKRIWMLFKEKIEVGGEDDLEVKRMLNTTVKEVTRDIGDFSYNTAIARLMEFYNFLSGRSSVSKSLKGNLSLDSSVAFLKLISPFTPHLAEEIYQCLVSKNGKSLTKSIHLELWPKHDESLVAKSRLIIVIQVNGKKRGELDLSTDEASDKELVNEKARDKVAKHLDGKFVKNTVFIPGRIINFVV